MQHFKFIYRLLLVVLMVQTAFSGMGQETLQVLTKTVEKDFQGIENEVINIEGYKSTINVATWSKNEIKVVLKLISKSPDRKTAKTELGFQRYILEKRRGTIHIKNYLALPSGVTKLNSIQVSSYHITVPKGCKLQIKNEYGDVNLKQLYGFVKVNTKYGKVQLDDINAAVDINTYFGDLQLNNVDGIVKLNANHTNVDMEDIGGQVRLQLTLGDLFVGKINNHTDLTVTASKADITIEQPDYDLFNFEMDTSYGDILVPDELRKYFKSDTQKRKSFIYESTKQGSPIKLKTTFGNIVAK